MQDRGTQITGTQRVPLGSAPVFLISAITIIIFVVGSLVFRESATKLFGATRVWLTTNFDWWFIDITNILLLFCLFLIFSPLGRIRIGGQDAKPEYSNLTWFAMLFAAGVSASDSCSSVSLNPLHHFQNPPLGYRESLRLLRQCIRLKMRPALPRRKAKAQSVAVIGIASANFPLGVTRLGRFTQLSASPSDFSSTTEGCP